MNQFKAISLALLAGGILLLIFGIIASTSLSSDVSRIVTGSISDRAIWLLTGGAAASVAGVAGLMTRTYRS